MVVRFMMWNFLQTRRNMTIKLTALPARLSVLISTLSIILKTMEVPAGQ